MRIRQVFVDMDGVLVEFVDAVIKWYNLPCTRKDIISWDSLMDFTDMSTRQFWDNLPREFWIDLPMTKEAIEILNLLERFQPVILTAPTLTNAGWKQEWIRKHLPKLFYSDRYALARKKSVFAGPGLVLVDDCEANIGAWRDEGGYGILVPRPWNSLNKLEPYLVTWIDRQVKYIMLGE